MREYHKVIENLTRTNNTVKSINDKIKYVERKLNDPPFMHEPAQLQQKLTSLKDELKIALLDRENARRHTDDLFATMQG